MTLPTAQDVKTVLSSLWARLTADLSVMWQKDRFFLLIFGTLVVLAKGSSLLIDFLAYRSKKEVEAATKENNVLQAQENADNSQADALVKQANELPGQEKPVDSNWDKEKK